MHHAPTSPPSRAPILPRPPDHGPPYAAAPHGGLWRTLPKRRTARPGRPEKPSSRSGLPAFFRQAAPEARGKANVPSTFPSRRAAAPVGTGPIEIPPSKGVRGHRLLAAGGVSIPRLNLNPSTPRPRQNVIEKCEPLTNIFDIVHQFWEHPRTQRGFAAAIFVVYLAGLIGIEANRQDLLPPWLAHITPMSHFQAIHLAFTLILGMEVMELILTISGSLSKSLGKQFEVMALILLRDAFKELSKLPEPVSLAAGIQPVVHIASAGVGALFIFVCLGFYYQLRTHQNYISDPGEQMRYVMSKKLISLGLFLLFVGIALRDLALFSRTGEDVAFFETIYTVLIFADIALVLISQRFMPSFHAVFRNSGFVIGTLLMRLSLSAPWPWNIAASLFAALFVLALTWATTYFGPSRLRRPLPR